MPAVELRALVRRKGTDMDVTVNSMVDRAVSDGMNPTAARTVLTDVLANYTGDDLEYQLVSLGYASEAEAYHYAHQDPGMPEVVEWIKGKYGPVGLVRLTYDDWNQHCYKCCAGLAEGDLAQDCGDHWLCRNCAR